MKNNEKWNKKPQTHYHIPEISVWKGANNNNYTNNKYTTFTTTTTTTNDNNILA